LKQALRTTLFAMVLVLFALMTFSPFALAFDDEGYVPEAAPAAPVFQDTFWYPSVMLTNWKDFGSAPTSESGGVFGVGLTGKLPLSNSFLLRSSGEVFGGHVGFTGNGIAGNALSNNGGTDYLGLKVAADLGRSYLGPAMIGFEPFAGLGFRYWDRDIKPGNGNLLERWTSLYARAGVRATHYVSKGTSIFAEGGAVYPVFTRVSASGSLSGNSVSGSFNPGGLVSVFAELGGDVGGFRPSIYYEGFRFSSDKAMAESEGNTVGVKFGVPF
jgi:hypothetical protein